MKTIHILNKSNNRCVATGKQKLRTAKAAKKYAHILKYASKNKIKYRKYRCDWCLRWHLTTQTIAERENKPRKNKHWDGVRLKTPLELQK